MIIERIEIKNFRSLETVQVDCEELVAFVGRNGSGKSSILYALDTFYDVSAPITNEDFYNRDTDREIVIRVNIAVSEMMNKPSSDRTSGTTSSWSPRRLGTPTLA